ncbi:MAG: tetratricopeptide repeat protein [Candidatus Aminicenantes bacterium]|nr:tetratricopeptide repeat protein [Candidatus Aminicenantes bacterium]
MKPKLLLSILLALLLGVLAAFSQTPAVSEAWAAVRKGFHSWNPEVMKAARDRLLAVLLTEKTPNAGHFHGLSVADFRLASYYLASDNGPEAERYTAEAREYGRKARELDPGLGESYALDGYLIGVEIALFPERAMSLISESMQSFQAAFAKSPANPRVLLLRALSVYYTPEPYGGGPGNAMSILEEAVGLFEKEMGGNPSPSAWGYEEACAYLGLCHKSRGDMEKAEALLKKALELAPGYAFAAHELQSLSRK